MFISFFNLIGQKIKDLKEKARGKQKKSPGVKLFCEQFFQYGLTFFFWRPSWLCSCLKAETYIKAEKSVCWKPAFTSFNSSSIYMPPILVSSSAKHIATHILVIAKLSGTRHFILSSFVCDINVPARNYLFKVCNWSSRIRCENCSKLRIKTLERCQWCHSNVFIFNYEHISSFVLIVEFEQANVWVADSCRDGWNVRNFSAS